MLQKMLKKFKHYRVETDGGNKGKSPAGMYDKDGRSSSEVDNRFNKCRAVTRVVNGGLHVTTGTLYNITKTLYNSCEK